MQFEKNIDGFERPQKENFLLINKNKAG